MVIIVGDNQKLNVTNLPMVYEIGKHDQTFIVEVVVNDSGSNLVN